MPRTQTDARARNRQTAARQYRKLGYDVVECPSGDQLPPFLRGLSPDLIATSEADRVVLEIKRAADLKGSNELKELAAAVDQHTGWRFELIALGPSPRDVVPPSETTLDRLTERALALYRRWFSRCRAALCSLRVGRVDQGCRGAAPHQGETARDEGHRSRPGIPWRGRRGGGGRAGSRVGSTLPDRAWIGV